jgi:L-asparaginase II
MHQVIAEVVRSGFVEGHHHGSVLAVGPAGEQLYAAGDVTGQILPRSCNKPVQALGMLRAGLDLDGELLALAAASHSGESIHVAGVRRILAGAGLAEDDLQCPPDWPLARDVHDELLRAGGQESRVLMNCSGKHAAMLATCVANGWPTDSYLAVDHPLQQAIFATFAEVTGEEVATSAVDGCGAPLLSTSLTGLARAFARIATASDGPERKLADAIRQHPEYVSGTTRDERTLLGAIPGAIGKVGAEACYVIALPDGRAFALKVDDGSDRARPIVMAALLRKLGVDTEPGVDTAAVRRTGEHVLLGGGDPVGEIRAVL